MILNRGESARLEELLNVRGTNFEKWITNCRTAIRLCLLCTTLVFNNGSSQEKFNILKALGSNLTLKYKKLVLELHNPLKAILEQILKQCSRNK